MRGGFGIGIVEWNDLVVAALAVVNAVGDVLDEVGGVLAGAKNQEGRFLAEIDSFRNLQMSSHNILPVSNTTLVAILTNARLSKVDVNRVAQRGHDGLARALKPVHTMYDGDIVFGLASGEVPAAVDTVAEAGADAASAAIRNAVRAADPHPSITSLQRR
jgi:L-aminopeptidase/D-esterase-like protein